MVKRCLVAVSAVLILIPVLCFSVFADTEWYAFDQTVLDEFFSPYDVRISRTNNGGNGTKELYDSENGTLRLRGTPWRNGNEYYMGITNNSNKELTLVLHFSSSFWSSNHSDTLTLVIPKEGYIEFPYYARSGSTYVQDIFTLYRSETSFINPYSVFDTTPLFPIISSLYTFITGNTILIVLFFIGVTISLGFVAIRFIRKVMWGN